MPAVNVDDSRDDKTNMCPGLEDSAKVMVALDLGTTFSGFAFAHRSHPYDIHTNRAWPSQTDAVTSASYCKTQTSLLYERSTAISDCYKLGHWGWPALLSFQRALRETENQSKRPRLTITTGLGYDQQARTHTTLPHVSQDRVKCAHVLPDGGSYVSCFKLYLAHLAGVQSPVTWSCEPLPPGLDIDRLMTDYLKSISEFAFEYVKDRYGTQLERKDIQWCLTVPAVWAEQAKHMMKQYACRAGLSEDILNASPNRNDSNPHPLRIILEPEAASLYCLHRAQYACLQAGDIFAVMDVGGATIDLVVHERMPSRTVPMEVKEIARSVGCLGGGIFVDEHYLHVLAKKIPCLLDFLQDDPSCRIKLLSSWQSKKFTYNGIDTQIEIDLPWKLAKTWKKVDRNAGGVTRDHSYGIVILTEEDLQQIMEPEVDKVIRLLEQQISLNLQAIFMVGGFSASPYLMKRVRQTFETRIKKIISPPDPGSAICQGAILFCMSKEPVTCRISKKTYGVRCRSRFDYARDPREYLVIDDDNKPRCRNVFSVYVKIGDTVLYDQNVESVFYPCYHGQKKMRLQLFSTTEENPRYTTGKDCVMEGQIVVDISQDLHKDKSRKVCVSMHFGRSTIEMSAKGLNFGDGRNLGTLPVSFQQAVDIVG